MNVESILATPALWYPGQEDGEWREEVSAMMQRAIATRQLLNGEISFPDYLDIVEYSGIEMDSAVSSWSEGLSAV